VLEAFLVVVANASDRDAIGHVTVVTTPVGFDPGTVSGGDTWRRIGGGWPLRATLQGKGYRY
jgi:hypothetical protein